MSAFQLPTLVGPSAPPLPRPTGLPRSQRRISGVAQLADMTDGKRCAFSVDETRTLSREVSNNVHVGNKLPWPFDKKVTITLIDQQPCPKLRRNIHMCSYPRNDGHFSPCYSRPVEERAQKIEKKKKKKEIGFFSVT